MYVELIKYIFIPDLLISEILFIENVIKTIGKLLFVSITKFISIVETCQLVLNHELSI